MPHPKIALLDEDIGLYGVIVYPINARMKAGRATTGLLMDAATETLYEQEDHVFYICLKPNGQIDGILDENWEPVIGPRRPPYDPDKLKAFWDSLPTWIMPTILDVGPRISSYNIRPINLSLAELQARKPAPQGDVMPPLWMAYQDLESGEREYEKVNHDVFLTRTHEMVRYNNGAWARLTDCEICEYSGQKAAIYFAKCDEEAAT